MCFLLVSVGEVESLLLSVGTCSLPSLLSQPPTLRVLETKQVKLCLSLKRVGRRGKEGGEPRGRWLGGYKDNQRGRGLFL